MGPTTGWSRPAEPMASPKPPLLGELATESGVSVPCAGNLPLRLDDHKFAWFIEQGAVDLFLVETKEGAEQSAPQHLLRADAGRLLPGVAPQAGPTTLGLIAKGLPGTQLRRLPVSSLTVISKAELAGHVDAWLTDLSVMLGRDVLHRPHPDELLEPDQVRQTDGGTVSARRGVVWVSGLAPGEGLYLGLTDAGDTGSHAIPLTPDSWLTLMGPTSLTACSSEALAREDRLLPALAHFHATALSLERLNRSLAVADQVNLERARASNRRDDEEGARRHLFNLYGLLRDEEGAEVSGTALRETLMVIGRCEGIDFKWPPRQDATDSTPKLDEILDVSGVRARQVRLSEKDRWWTSDSGTMLGYRKDDGQPVALVPGLFGSYRAVDPVQQRTTRITSANVGSFHAEAWLFYVPLNAAGAGLHDLFRIAKTGAMTHLVRFMGAGLLAGLILLLPAVVLGYITDEVIPSGETGLLYLACAALAAFALIGALAHIFQGMALMRLEGRAVSRIEAAFWDRMLRLPPSILHRYPAGDLAMRGMTFQQLRDAGQSVIANTVLSVIFLLPVFFLIFFYDTALGTITSAFAVASLVVTVALGVRQIAPHGRVIRVVHRLAGRLFQLINGISKLRVDGAEGSAFAVWAREYREQKNAELELGTFEGHLQAFGAALPLLAGAVLLLAVTMLERNTLAVGDFLVVYVVFLVFQSAVARLGESFSAVAAILPAFDQVRPLLDEAPETSVYGEPVQNLGGEIVFDQVSFRYDPNGPLILDNVSIRARPGEFIAIAGESGAGKSTLFRLALGLDHPSSGAVYYDGRDLKHLNVKQLRRKIGAVPQDVQLHPEDVWDNIIGDYEGASEEDAWEAARTAAVDKEIKAMPMGLMTCVGASASVTSGGESQRIMIAQALIRNPRILLLDEATNWLDNESQARVMANLAGLTSTRLVIAHRLSTLRQADRIYVLRAGRVVQAGAYEELMASEGVFRDLVRRQLA